MKKKIISMIMALTLLVCFTAIPAMALEDTVHPHGTDVECNEDLDIELYYVVSCPYANKHSMTGRGIAWIMSGSGPSNPGSQLVYGFANQCRNCNIVLGSEGNPRLSGVLGKYRLQNYSSAVSNNGVVMYGGLTGSFYGSLVQDSYWAGYEFT